VVLYIVVSPSKQILSYFGPLVPEFIVKLYYFPVFVLCPFILFNSWVEVIVPPLFKRTLPFPALLADSAREGF